MLAFISIWATFSAIKCHSILFRAALDLLRHNYTLFAGHELAMRLQFVCVRVIATDT